MSVVDDVGEVLRVAYTGAMPAVSHFVRDDGSATTVLDDGSATTV